MLNYTTTTIVNSADMVEAVESPVKKFRVKFGPELWNDANHTPCLVKKTAYAAAVKASATVTLPTSTGVYRIAMYIRLRNNNNPYFSNEWTFKGKPLYIEFTGNDDVDKIIARAKKLMLTQYGYNLVDLSKSSDKLVITAHDQWEMFMTQDSTDGVVVEKLVTVDVAGNVIAAGDVANSPTHEAFVVDSTATVVINNGNEAFGDFAHIVKDLRLPTAANLRWQGIAAGDVFGDEPNDDRPLPTGKYTQYTIEYDAERGILQQTALGGLATSRTVHVFYVESAAVSAFDTALETAGIVAAEHAHLYEGTLNENVLKAVAGVASDVETLASDVEDLAEKVNAEESDGPEA